MGEIVKAEVVATLQRLNPGAKPAVIQIYADALISYRLAQANIDEYGAIVNHPRTGAPIENPYLRVQAAAAKQMLAQKHFKTDGLWDLTPRIAAPKEGK